MECGPLTRSALLPPEQPYVAMPAGKASKGAYTRDPCAELHCNETGKPLLLGGRSPLCLLCRLPTQQKKRLQQKK